MHTIRAKKTKAGSCVRKSTRLAVGLLFLLSFFLGTGRSDLFAAKEGRAEFTISTGMFGSRNVGFASSYGLYFVPRVLKLDFNITMLTGGSSSDDRRFPFSLNLSLHLPVSLVTPFVTAGVGIAIPGTFIQNYGAGIKIGRRMSFLIEYRYFTYNISQGGGESVQKKFSYVGLGLALR